MKSSFSMLLICSAFLAACATKSNLPAPDAGVADAGDVDAGHECPQGFTGANCDQDIDECAVDVSPCKASEDCINTPGTFSCTPKFRSLSIGSDHACVIRGDQSLWCWGSNQLHELGDGTTESRAAPIQVGTDHDWASVSARGWAFTCALKTNGTLWCWGYNVVGQLGLGHVTEVPVPTQVGTDNDWSSVSTSLLAWHTCALKTNNTLWCWGHNDEGQLGVGTEQFLLEPTQVGAEQDWRTIELGQKFACGLKTDGTIWCTGDNTNGNLGNGHYGSGVRTFQQVGTDVDWASVLVGAATVCATKKDGSLWCWGENSSGQTGHSSPSFCVTSPTQVGSDKDWARGAPGESHTCGAKRDGSAWCWGYNGNGQLGDGTRINSTTPVAVAGGHHWISLAVAPKTTCGRTDDGGLYCWGSDGEVWESGLLGLNAPSFVAEPTAIAEQGWVTVNAGIDSACAIKKDGSLSCWGRGLFGELGQGGYLNADVPTTTDAVRQWKSVSVGRSTSCAIATNGTLWCWGYDPYAGPPLPVRSEISVLTPLQVGTDNDWSEVRVPTWNGDSCGLKTNGELWCWQSIRQAMPARVGYETWTAVTRNAVPQYAIRSDGTLWVWPSMTTSPPSKVVTDTDWKLISGTEAFTCGVKTWGALFCWGSNADGQLGTGGTEPSETPVEIEPGSRWMSIATIQTHGGPDSFATCGVKTNGTLWCWGRNERGGIGLGRDVTATKPTRIGTSADWRSVSLGATNGYALRADGSLWVWGQSTYGQLGLDGLYEPEPVLVLH